MSNLSVARARPVAGSISLWQSSVGKKYVMAVTGLIWFLYLVLHLWGNLKIYSGAEPLDAYASFLRTVGAPFFGYSQLLWLVRLLLIPAFIAHVVAAIQLKRRDRAGRPRGYAMIKYREATFASRTMIWGGLLIIFFVIYHLLDFTFGTVNPSFQEGNVYHNVVASFRLWYVSLFYMLAMIAVGMHLFHGLWSAFQSLGLNTSRSTRLIRNVVTVIVLLLTIGNLSIPLAVVIGIVK